MFIRIDESGEFDFRRPRRVEIGVIAALIAPDLHWDEIQSFVSSRKAAWAMLEELKAVAMDESQQLEMAEFIRARGLRFVAVATDSRIFTIESQRRWRAEQVGVFEAAADRSRRAREVPKVRERVNRLRTRLPSERHVRPPNFLQYSILMPWLLSRSLSAALIAYRRMPPGADSWTFDVAVDARRGADPGKPGEVLRDSLEAILAADDATSLLVPREWGDDHPFKERNRDPETGSTSTRQVLRRGVKHADSSDDAGLQLADFVAHAIYSALRKGDAAAIAVWRTLRPAAVAIDGWDLNVWAWPADEVTPEDEARYMNLLHA